MWELNTLLSRKTLLTASKDSAAYNCSGIIDSGVLDQSITLPLNTPGPRRFSAENGYGSSSRLIVSSAVRSCTGLSTADLPRHRTNRRPADNTVKLTVLRSRRAAARVGADFRRRR